LLLYPKFSLVFGQWYLSSNFHARLEKKKVTVIVFCEIIVH